MWHFIKCLTPADNPAGHPFKIAVKRDSREVVLGRCGILICVTKIETLQFHRLDKTPHLYGIESDHRRLTVYEEILDETAKAQHVPETAENYTNRVK